jgi:hypothetical protein
MGRRAGALARTITIYLNDGDADIKSMIKDLKISESKNNPFVGRSESDIAKLLLLSEIRREHKRFCTTAKRAKKQG